MQGWKTQVGTIRMYAMVVLVLFRDETRAHIPCATVTTQAVMYGMVVWYHCTILQKFADFSEEEVNGHSPIF